MGDVTAWTARRARIQTRAAANVHELASCNSNDEGCVCGSLGGEGRDKHGPARRSVHRTAFVSTPCSLLTFQDTGRHLAAKRHTARAKRRYGAAGREVPDARIEAGRLSVRGLAASHPLLNGRTRPSSRVTDISVCLVRNSSWVSASWRTLTHAA